MIADRMRQKSVARGRNNFRKYGSSFHVLGNCFVGNLKLKVEVTQVDVYIKNGDQNGVTHQD